MKRMAGTNKMNYLIILLVAIGVMFLVQNLPAKKKMSRDEIDSLINLKSAIWGVETAVVYAVVEVESNFNPRAKNPADPSYGLMQITPILAQDYGYVMSWRYPTEEEIEAIYDPENNLDMGCQFLKKLLGKYNFNIAIQMFNTGEYGYQKGVRNLEYLYKVQKAYEQYKKI